MRIYGNGVFIPKVVVRGVFVLRWSSSKEYKVLLAPALPCCCKRIKKKKINRDTFANIILKKAVATVMKYYIMKLECICTYRHRELLLRATFISTLRNFDKQGCFQTDSIIFCVCCPSSTKIFSFAELQHRKKKRFFCTCWPFKIFLVLLLLLSIAKSIISNCRGSRKWQTAINQSREVNLSTSYLRVVPVHVQFVSFEDIWTLVDVFNSQPHCRHDSVAY